MRNSLAGTLVNGQKISGHQPLKDGHTSRICDFSFSDSRCSIINWLEDDAGKYDSATIRR